MQLRGDVAAEDDTARENVERAAFIHREILQLGGLILAAVGAFFLTRAVAASSHDTRLRDAAEWYHRGETAVAAGKLDDAIAAFRRATIRARTNRQYVLALARALARSGDDDVARNVLLALRDTAPDDAGISLELARLAARREDVTEAVRYYHNALYAPWPLELSDARRQIRLELIRFLLTHDQSSRAQSELLAIAADLPDQAPAHVEVGRLFVDAGDYRHGLEQFQRALRQAPADPAALVGAGDAAFRMGQYGLARTYLRRAPDAVPAAAATLSIVEHVLADDPLAARIGSSERRRRLRSNLEYVGERLGTCAAERAGASTTADEVALQHEAEAFRARLRRSALDQDIVEAGVDLVDRIAQRLLQACAAPTARDRALTVIGREHGDRR
jgi:tetratricopeptide (TPR) repeat protein